MPGFISLHTQHKTNLYTHKSIPESDWDRSGVLIPKIVHRLQTKSDYDLIRPFFALERSGTNKMYLYQLCYLNSV